MQGLDWSDLRVLLALGRAGTISGAARRLSVDATTVSRRLARLQATLGTTLMERATGGALIPTAAGTAALRHAESIEREIGALSSGLSGADAEAVGTVRLTAVPILVSRLLVPRTGAFLASHPGLALELVADPRNLSLTRREADMAIRLARPGDGDGGGRVRTRRIGTLSYAAYAPATATDAGARALPWITYEEGHSGLPQAQWISRVARSARSAALSPLRVSDAEALVEAVAAGIGRSLLPVMMAGTDRRLRPIATDGAPAVPKREVWLMVHEDLAKLKRITVVTAWIAAMFNTGRAP